MYYGVSFGNLWREALKDEDGSYSLRSLSDEAERNFWQSHIKGRQQMPLDDYASDVWSGVVDIIGDQRFGKVLEIGPGWGNYTLRLRQIADEFSCVDISPAVLDHVKQNLRTHGFDMLSHCVKWEEFVGEGYDLVFGFNCFYRMHRIEDALSKIHRVAKKHIIGMTSGPEQEYFRVLEQQLGLAVRYHKFDYIHLANILYEQGVDVNIRILDLKREYGYPSQEEVYKSVIGRVKNNADIDRDAVLNLVIPYFTIDSEGHYHYTHHFKAGILYW